MSYGNPSSIRLASFFQEAARLQTVIDTVPSFVWTSLPDGSKEYLNKRWYEYTGLSLEEGKGWVWKVVVNPDDLDLLIREWLALVEARKTGELENANKTRVRFGWCANGGLGSTSGKVAWTPSARKGRPDRPHVQNILCGPSPQHPRGAQTRIVHTS